MYVCTWFSDLASSPSSHANGVERKGPNSSIVVVSTLEAQCKKIHVWAFHGKEEKLQRLAWNISTAQNISSLDRWPNLSWSTGLPRKNLFNKWDSVIASEFRRRKKGRLPEMFSATPGANLRTPRCAVIHGVTRRVPQRKVLCLN